MSFKKKITTELDFDTLKQRQNAAIELNALRFVAMEQNIVNAKQDQIANFGQDPKISQIATRGNIKPGFNPALNLQTMTSTHVPINLMNLVSNILATGTVNNDTYANVYRNINLLRNEIDDIISTKKHLLPELQNDFKQWVKLIDGKTNGYPFISNFVNETKAKIDGLKYVKPLAQVEKDEEREFRENVKAVAEHVKERKNEQGNDTL